VALSSPTTLDLVTTVALVSLAMLTLIHTGYYPLAIVFESILAGDYPHPAHRGGRRVDRRHAGRARALFEPPVDHRHQPSWSCPIPLFEHRVMGHRHVMTADLTQQRQRSHQWLGAAAFAAAVIVTAVIGSAAVTGTTEQYASLQQPTWAPPPWVFGPVWTVLYAMIAASGWLVWRRVGLGPAITVYGVQLVLNAIWTPLFFGGDMFGLAFADIVLLWILIGATIMIFWRISKLAAGLLLPYWAWVTFAALLNFAIWQLNS
jgi:tryptophan-rich sensory protein